MKRGGKAQKSSDESDFEVLPAGKMREKYGLTAGNRPTIKLASAKVPKSLRPLIPLAERFGISDDLIRTDYMNNVTATDLAELQRIVEENNDQLDEWLAGHAADGPTFSKEYIAFTCMRMAADGC